jgi:hypothetical protein
MNMGTIKIHPANVDGEVIGDLWTVKVDAYPDGTVLLLTWPWDQIEDAAVVPLNPQRATRLAKMLVNAATWAEALAGGPLVAAEEIDGRVAE